MRYTLYATVAVFFTSWLVHLVAVELEPLEEAHLLNRVGGWDVPLVGWWDLHRIIDITDWIGMGALATGVILLIAICCQHQASQRLKKYRRDDARG